MHHEPSRVVQGLLSLPGHPLGVPNQSSLRCFLKVSRLVERTPPWITRLVLTEMHQDEFRPQSRSCIPGYIAGMQSIGCYEAQSQGQQCLHVT